MKLLIGADLVPTATNEHLFIAGDADALFGKVVDVAKKADRVMINLELALTRHDGKIRKFGPNLKADPDCVNGYKALGVTDAFLSNNHVFDYGKQGLIDTEAALTAAGIGYTGVGKNDTDSRKPYFIEAEGGKRIGFINVCEHEYTYATPDRMGANPFDPFLTMQDIREAKKQCDYLVVIYHGGKEYCRYPSPRLYNLSHEMVLCGADAVIAQHSHCIGAYELFEGGHIVYGQGNFNFAFENYKRPECWYTGVLVELDTEDKSYIKFYPTYETAKGCDLAEGERAKEIMDGFEKRSAEMLDGSWRDGWHAFCTDPEREYYHRAISGVVDGEEGIQKFAHYLDCEAHTDVWRELYPTWNMTNEL